MDYGENGGKNDGVYFAKSSTTKLYLSRSNTYKFW